MPSAYTEILLNGMDPIVWLRTVAPRAMGMCVTLRDEDLTLTREQIEAKLKEDESYYPKRLQIIRDEEREVMGWGDDEWKEFALKQYGDLQKQVYARIEQQEKQKQRYERVRRLLPDIMDVPSGTENIIQNTVGFVMSQIVESARFDLYPVDLPERKDWKLVKAEHLIKLMNDRNYYQKMAREEGERRELRLKCWNEWQAYVDALEEKVAVQDKNVARDKPE